MHTLKGKKGRGTIQAGKSSGKTPQSWSGQTIVGHHTKQQFNRQQCKSTRFGIVSAGASISIKQVPRKLLKRLNAHWNRTVEDLLKF